MTTIAALRNARRQTRQAAVALTFGIVCIGFSAIFTKWAGVPGPVSGLYRVVIATMVLAPFAARGARRVVGLGPGMLGLAMLAGVWFAGDLAVWNTSLQYTSAANSTLLGNTSTLWVSLWSLVVLRERLGLPFWLGTVLALAGAAAIVGPDLSTTGTLGLGDGLALGSSLFYAAYLLTTGRVRRHAGTLEYMWLSSFGAALVLLVYCLATGLPLSGFTPGTYGSLLALALISHVGGWVSINYALGHLRASLTSVSLLAQPVITALASVPLLGEPLSPAQIGGGALVLAGIYLANRRTPAPGPHPAKTRGAEGEVLAREDFAPR
ncbi:MAG TPA: DMT family transporter [Chloroflexia bacterium]|nr:DMT family transporter [Chloroflexia bacterium]